MTFSKLLTRTISGLIYCGVIIGAIWAGQYGVMILSILLAVLASIEFAKICNETTANIIPALILDVAGCVALAVLPMEPTALMLWLGLMIARFIMQLYIISDHPVKDLSHSMMAQVYIGGPMLVMTFIGLFWSPMILLAMFLMIWINDTGAFLVGSAIGRHRLFERISPKKSWEGFFGGLAFNIIAGFLFYRFGNGFFGMERFGAGLWTWLLFGITITVFSTWGDLIESLVKRDLHIKDSGRLIPGHGGILDRIDSLLLVLPALLLFLLLLIFL